MKINFTQKHFEQLPLENLSTHQFLSLATETSKQLGWVFGDINETGFIAYTNNGLFSCNAEIKMKIINGLANLQSRSMGDGLKGMLENKKNIQSFISTFKRLNNTLLPKESQFIYKKAEMDFA
jgi:rhomboid protease GluP